jgi:hypothetical protein
MPVGVFTVRRPPENHIEPHRRCAHSRCELDTSFCSNDSLGRPHLHSPSLACRVFLIKKPYSSKRAKFTTNKPEYGARRRGMSVEHAPAGHRARFTGSTRAVLGVVARRAAKGARARLLQLGPGAPCDISLPLLSGSRIGHATSSVVGTGLSRSRAPRTPLTLHGQH